MHADILSQVCWSLHWSPLVQWVATFHPLLSDHPAVANITFLFCEATRLRKIERLSDSRRQLYTPEFRYVCLVVEGRALVSGPPVCYFHWANTRLWWRWSRNRTVYYCVASPAPVRSRTVTMFASMARNTKGCVGSSPFHTQQTLHIYWHLVSWAINVFTEKILLVLFSILAADTI